MSPGRTPSTPRGPVQGLADVAELLGGGRTERTGSFARGLVIGALVGAAIAGSAIWQRRRRPERDTDDPAGDR
jgi:hypothetical protein